MQGEGMAQQRCEKMDEERENEILPPEGSFETGEAPPEKKNRPEKGAEEPRRWMVAGYPSEVL